MKRVYVLEPGAYLRKEGESLSIVKEGQKIEEIPLKNLTQLILMGYTALSGAVLNILITRRVETVLLDLKGRFKARICLDEHKHVQRRIAQYLKLNQDDFVLKTIKSLIKGKLRNQARLLSVRGNRLKSEKVLNISVAIKALAREVDRINDVEMLRGVEGHGARLYFRAFGYLITNDEFSFKGRNKRPPLDPVNALLSFVYTLLTNEVLTAIKIVGLDPYLGALHSIEYGRPSLACDLVEEWRTILGDRLVLLMINKSIIRKDHFVYRKMNSTDFIDETDLKQKRPVEMKPNTCRAFLEAYEKFLNSKITYPLTQEKTTYRTAILRQVELFKNYLMGKEKEYRPIGLSNLL